VKPTPFTGSWRIVWMSAWDQDYVDMDVLGHITFGAGRTGSFQFGLVQGRMDCRLEGPSAQRIEFTWHGFDEGDEISGRGHADIVAGELQGHLYIHLGDDSALRAVKSIPSMRKRQATP
jgi:hypothetical protein